MKLTIRMTFLLTGLLAICGVARLLFSPALPASMLQIYSLSGFGLISFAAACLPARSPWRRFYAGLMLMALVVGTLASITLYTSWADFSSQLLQHLPGAEALAEALTLLPASPATAPSQAVVWIGYSLLWALTLWQLWRKSPERRRFG